MASLNIQDEPAKPNTSTASQNMEAALCDTVDGPVEFPENNVDVVYVNGDDKQLCLATVDVGKEKVTGCGRGDNRESAKQSAIFNLMSNFRILYPYVKI